MSVLYEHEKRSYHPIENKVVIITGASSGIGAEIATHFAKIGYKKLVIVRLTFNNYQVMVTFIERWLGERKGLKMLQPSALKMAQLMSCNWLWI